MGINSLREKLGSPGQKGFKPGKAFEKGRGDFIKGWAGDLHPP